MVLRVQLLACCIDREDHFAMLDLLSGLRIGRRMVHDRLRQRRGLGRRVLRGL
jgi:hypothetical protein